MAADPRPTRLHLRRARRHLLGGWYNENTPQEDRANADGGKRLQDRRRTSTGYRLKLRESNLRGWPLPKSLCGIPTLYAWSLAYGHNLLDPDRHNRAVADPQPHRLAPPQPPRRRPRRQSATIHLVHHRRLCQRQTVVRPGRRTDGDGTPRTATSIGRQHRQRQTGRARYSPSRPEQRPGTCTTTLPVPHRSTAGSTATTRHDVWTIPTAPYKGAHYATYPIALPRRLINLMCPRQVCTVCGEPRRRITEPSEEYAEHRNARGVALMDHAERRGNDSTRYPPTCAAVAVVDPPHSTTPSAGPTAAASINVGRWRRGLVLDCFAGSRNHLAPPPELGRDAIGIDLDERNLWTSPDERIGLFLEEPA